MVSGLATSHGALGSLVVCLLLGAFNVDHGLGRGASIRRTHEDGFHLSGVFMHLLLAAFNVIHGLDNGSSFKHFLIFFNLLHSSPNGCEGDD